MLSHEHDAMRWVSPDEALDLAVWPAYRESIRRIVENLLDPERAIWFELHAGGRASPAVAGGRDASISAAGYPFAAVAAS